MATVGNDQDFTQYIMDLEQTYVAQTYKRAPFVLTRGEGVMLYDANGNEYMDWCAGIAVNALGYSDPGLTSVLQEATGDLLHVTNLYHTAPHAELAKMLCELSFADRVFFCNSGTEAVEAAIKFARKTAYNEGKTDKTEIVSFTNGFHGRTMGALALTPCESYQVPFRPLMPGAVTAEYNNIESAKAAINDKTAAVIVEPVQGEGGVNPATNEFLQALRRLCDEHDAMLIFDQIQCGLGRTGTLWSSEPSGVTPDLQTLAKPLAGGLPIGAVLMTEAVASNLKPGDHGTTFGGGPVVTSAAKYIVGRISQPEFLKHVREVGDYLKERLSEINSPLIKEVRGRGLMIGVEMTVEVAPIIQAGYQNGMIFVNAGPNVLRFVPPLIIEKHHVDVMIEKLTAILAEMGEKVS